MNTVDYLNKNVKVIIDRKMGSAHPKHGFIYPVNYGYVPNTISGDGEELDCYVLGIFEAVNEFEGKCIAIIHRLNDNDDKLIVVPENRDFSELSVSNIDISKMFYLKLGFKIKYERKEDKFCFLQLEENQIMIEEQNDNWNTGKLEYPYGRGINISMMVSDVEKMYNELKEKNVKMFLDLEMHEYRVDNKISIDKEFLIQDPDGYLLRFNN